MQFSILTLHSACPNAHIWSSNTNNINTSEKFSVVPSTILPISDSKNDNELEHCDDAQCHIVDTYHYILWLFEMHILEKNSFFRSGLQV